MQANEWPALDGIPKNALALFTIYDHPLDFPGFWVVRRFFGCHQQAGMPGLVISTAPDEPIQDVVPRLANSLAEARALVPQGLYRQPRMEGDDPFIVETWF